MKIKFNNLPDGFEVRNGEVVETKKTGGSTGDQKNYGLVVNPNDGYHDDADIKINYSMTSVPRDEANIEAEGGETVLADLNGDGSFNLFDIKGPRHGSGGVPLFLPEQSFVFSDFSKMKFTKDEMAEMGVESKKRLTPAKISKKFGLNEYHGLLKDPYADDIQAKTAELMLDKNKRKLSKLSFMQEAKKDFEEGVPVTAFPFLVEQGHDPIEYTQQVEEITRQQAEQKFIESLPPEQQMQIAAMQQYMAQVDQQQQQQQESSQEQGMLPQSQQMQQQDMQQMPQDMSQQSMMPPPPEMDNQQLAQMGFEVEGMSYAQNGSETDENLKLYLSNYYKNRGYDVSKPAFKDFINSIINADEYNAVRDDEEVFKFTGQRPEGYVPRETGSYSTSDIIRSQNKNQTVDPKKFVPDFVKQSANYRIKELLQQKGFEGTNEQILQLIKETEDLKRQNILPDAVAKDPTLLYDPNIKSAIETAKTESFNPLGLRSIFGDKKSAENIFEDLNATVNSMVSVPDDQTLQQDPTTTTPTTTTPTTKRTPRTTRATQQTTTAPSQFSFTNPNAINPFAQDSQFKPVVPGADQYQRNKDTYTLLEKTLTDVNDTEMQGIINESYNRFLKNAKDQGLTNIPEKEELIKEFLKYQKNNYNVRNLATEKDRFNPNLDKAGSIGKRKNQVASELFEKLSKENPEYEGYEINDDNLKAVQLYFQTLYQVDSEKDNPRFGVEQLGPGSVRNWEKNKKISQADEWYGNDTLNQFMFVANPKQQAVEPDDEPDNPVVKQKVDEDINIQPNQLKVPYNPNDPRFWLQDLLKLNAIASRKRKKFYPWQPAVEDIDVDYVLEDPTRAIAATNEQMNLMAQGLGTFGGPQSFNSRMANVQAKTAANIANVIAGVHNRNINTINRGQAQQAQYDYMIDKENRTRNTKLYDDTMKVEQNALIEENFDREQYADALANAYSNMANTYNMNTLYDNFNIDPTTGGMVYFTNPTALDPSPNYEKSKMDNYINMNNQFRSRYGRDMNETEMKYFLGAKDQQQLSNYQREALNMANPGNVFGFDYRGTAKRGKQINKLLPFFSGQIGI